MGLVGVHSRAMPWTWIHPDPGRGRLSWRKQSRWVNGMGVVGLRMWWKCMVIVLPRGRGLTIVWDGGRFDQHIVEARRA